MMPLSLWTQKRLKNIKIFKIESLFLFDDNKKKINNKYFEKELGLEKDAAAQRTLDQGKEKGRDKKAPKKISKLKNFIDRLILKEKELDESKDIIEDTLVNKSNDEDLKNKNKEINHLLLRNIKSLKRVAKDNNISVKELIELIKNEQ